MMASLMLSFFILRLSKIQCYSAKCEERNTGQNMYLGIRSASHPASTLPGVRANPTAIFELNCEPCPFVWAQDSRLCPCPSLGLATLGSNE
ncbi:hypothetical protein C8Q74DRAFT_574056 [Fomes fomentarius]|nr:hypothetical protein C8Q74DRAFT_574056 [Fomes fomentarius]